MTGSRTDSVEIEYSVPCPGCGSSLETKFTYPDEKPERVECEQCGVFSLEWGGDEITHVDDLLDDEEKENLEPADYPGPAGEPKSVAGTLVGAWGEAFGSDWPKKPFLVLLVAFLTISFFPFWLMLMYLDEAGYYHPDEGFRL